MSMDDLRLRRGTAADLDVVMHHRTCMFRDMGSTADELRAMEINSRPQISKGLAEGNYQAWFFEDASGRVVAGGGITLVEYHSGPRDPEPRRAWVVNVYTELEYRKRGLARRLMEEMVQWTRDQGYHSLSLHASDFGRPLYESMGFVPTNEMRLRFD